MPNEFAEKLTAAMIKDGLDEFAKMKPRQTFVPTATCCDSRIRKALLDGLMPPGPWVCPKCHCDWLPREVEGVIVWEAHPIVQVLPNRHARNLL